ncbi:MAG: glutathione peroxidase [Ignavibacteriales bacterium]|nr:glutathione peroxidase [Ignavibacteriales bacterium]
MIESIYSVAVKSMNGKEIQLSDYQGKVLLIVNTASKCGFTPQFESLQKLYDKYSDKGFSVLGFPCNQFGEQDPGTDEEIKSFCSLNYGVTFPMFSKVEVNGENAHPLFIFLKAKSSGFLFKKIRWNFTKFLVDRQGSVVKRFSPAKDPISLENYIENIL